MLAFGGLAKGGRSTKGAKTGKEREKRNRDGKEREGHETYPKDLGRLGPERGSMPHSCPCFPLYRRYKHHKLPKPLGITFLRAPFESHRDYAPFKGIVIPPGPFLDQSPDRLPRSSVPPSIYAHHQPALYPLSGCLI